MNTLATLISIGLAAAAAAPSPAITLPAATVIASGGPAIFAPEARPQAGPTRADARDQRFRGFVMPSREVELMAPLEEILRVVEVEEGDRVEAGQLLARMDDRLQEVVVEAAKIRAESQAELERAALDLEDAKLTLELTLEAYERTAAHESEVRRARLTVSQAEAALIAAQENHALAQVNLRLEDQRLARYQIRAPFAGTVVEVLTEAGSMMNDVDRVLRLAKLDELEARIDLPIAIYGELTVGDTCTLVAEHPVNAEIRARLKFVSPVIDTASRTFRCVFTIANEDERLPAGFTVFLKR